MPVHTPFRQAGARDQLTPQMLASAGSVFDSWLDENADIVREMGGSGDIHSLFAALWDVWKNA